MNYVSIQVKARLIQLLMRRGYSYTGADITLNELKTDWNRNKANKKYSLIKKLSWYKQGYLIESASKREEINDHRYYIPEFEYFKKHPINGRYSAWIDDKLTIRYMLDPFKEYLPKYYFQINKNNIKCLPDCPKELINDKRSIIRLLIHVKCIALKPFAATSGIGFIKLEYINKTFYKNLVMIEEKQLYKFLSGLENYLVTEYILSHHLFTELNTLSTSTLRVIVMNLDNQPKITATYLRIGTKASGVVDNTGAGGIYTSVDIANGNIRDIAIYGNRDHHTKVEVHPDSKKVIKGTIPHWELLNKRLVEISNYLPQLIYLGYDIAITEDSFKIIEINSLQGFINLESYFECEVDKTYEQFFKRILHK